MTVFLSDLGKCAIKLMARWDHGCCGTGKGMSLLERKALGTLYWAWLSRREDILAREGSVSTHPVPVLLQEALGNVVISVCHRKQLPCLFLLYLLQLWMFKVWVMKNGSGCECSSAEWKPLLWPYSKPVFWVSASAGQLARLLLCWNLKIGEAKKLLQVLHCRWSWPFCNGRHFVLIHGNDQKYQKYQKENCGHMELTFLFFYIQVVVHEFFNTWQAWLMWLLYDRK